MNTVKLLEAKGIRLQGKSSGSIKTLCPICSTSRKAKNQKDQCLSVDITEGIFNCHNCDFRGRVFERIAKEYTKPAERLEKVGKEALQFFEQRRKISNNTLLRFGVTEAMEWMPQFGEEIKVICFNYFRKDQLVNIKFRGKEKSFKMSKDAELIFYNLDAIEGEDECVIVEGEIDCLTMHEAGIYNAVSVPNGASKGNAKLEYLDNCWQYFENKKKVILAVDNDEAGRSLREELARRIGKEKCFTVEYPEGCKDANEVLVLHGSGAVKAMVQASREWPLEGIKTMDEMYPTIADWYEMGYPKGAKTRIPGFDDLLTFAPGQLTIVTGIPGHGKNEFIDYIISSLAMFEGWPTAICEFEESPEETTTKLIEKITGKSFDFRVNTGHRVSTAELEYGIAMVDKNFFFIDTEETETDLDGILDKGKELVKKKGIKAFVLSPWNWVEHNRPTHITETEYVSLALTKIIRFARSYKVHFFLLAHTTKISKGKDGKKYEVPNLYSISGSANFFNKAHNGLTIYRDYDTGQVDVYVQKVKQSWLGKIGFCSFFYNTMTRQYQSVNSLHVPSGFVPVKPYNDN